MENPQEIKLVLHKIEPKDNPSYKWVYSGKIEGDEGNCIICHSDPDNPNSLLPYDEWIKDAHSKSALNPRFLTMYHGTDVKGNQSPETKYGYNKDYGSFPSPPDKTKPYYGPGYKLDFPNKNGNCGACHLPLDAINNAYGINPKEIGKIGKEGISCDFCHKIWEVTLDPETNLPYPNTPGVLSYEYRRPFKDKQFFAGPYHDVWPGEDTYSPNMNESKFCAPCHFGEFWGKQIYNSFGEWEASSYSDKETGQTCQDCHMPNRGTHYIALKEKGGVYRDPLTIFSHLMKDSSDIPFVKETIKLEATVQKKGVKLMVDITLTNETAGHHFPTGSPLRHMILVVQGKDKGNNNLELIDGELLPSWCGIGDIKRGNYGNIPGKVYAKVLKETWTDISPTGAYWNPITIVQDNRIPALKFDKSRYIFKLPDSKKGTFKIKLIYRKAYKELQEQKGWNLPDIVMEESTLNF
jgi:nitrate/TMAO reductase-like tetraheme cytochrome c subunit